MTDMVYGTVRIQSGEPILPKWWRTVDTGVLTCVLLLFALGLLLGLASSPALAAKNGHQGFHYVQRQAIFGGFAIVVMMLTSMMNVTLVRRLSVVLFALSLVALLLLPILGTDHGKGATRWFDLGFISFQPSEFMKPVFVVSAAWMLAAAQELNGPPGRLWSFVICVGVVLTLALQPDFGQASLVLFSWGVMYFIAGAPITLLLCMACLVVVGGGIAYANSDHFARRIDGYLSADVDPRTQLGYAADAIKEGGIFGTGVGEGRVKMLLPDAHTDFIIAVAAEEYGLIMVLFIIALFAIVVLRSLFRLVREKDPFIRLAGTGLVCVFGVQAMINMGVAVRLLPAKGMTLPFVSYGGSSVIASAITLGMLLAFTRTRPQGEMSDILGRGRLR